MSSSWFDVVRVTLVMMAAAAVMGCSSLSSTVPALPPHKPMASVSVDDLIADTQVIHTDPFSLVQAWWIPLEFWQASLGRINPQLAQEVSAILGDYSLVAVVQADVSALGGFVFYSRDDLQRRLRVQWQVDDATPVSLDLVTEPNVAVRNLVQQLSPLLSRTMGDMGRNLQFFVLNDRAADGGRLVDPYRRGQVLIGLSASETQPAAQLAVELPLDALFERRYCANGKPARVTWRFCPWDGRPL